MSYHPILNSANREERHRAAKPDRFAEHQPPVLQQFLVTYKRICLASISETRCPERLSFQFVTPQPKSIYIKLIGTSWRLVFDQVSKYRGACHHAENIYGQPDHGGSQASGAHVKTGCKLTLLFSLLEFIMKRQNGMKSVQIIRTRKKIN
jgi:hypothetical protein